MFYDDPKNHKMRHNPFKALVAPRPIAWVSSMDSNGLLNLAPFSYFNAVADAPPMVFFSPNGPRPAGGAKDTLNNIEETNEFVVNLCSWELRDAMNKSSASVDPDVDEFALAGVTPADCVHVKVPRVKEAPASLECKFLTRISMPSSNPISRNNMIIGEVVGVHIDDRIIEDGMVNTTAYHPLARHGYMDYSATENVFEMMRPGG